MYVSGLTYLNMHYDISALCAENELSGIHMVNEELVWVSECGQRLRNERIRVLERGLGGLNQADRLVCRSLTVIILLLLLQC